MQRLITLLLPMIISTACLTGVDFGNGKNKPIGYLEMSNKIISEVISRLKKRYNVEVVGLGSGMIDCVNRVGITFQINRGLPLEKIREMLVEMMEEFLASFNADEQIRPFLKNYPFTVNEIDIGNWGQA